MDVNELILELQKLKDDGYGKLKVKFDFGACEVERIYVEKDCTGDEYVHLDCA